MEKIKEQVYLQFTFKNGMKFDLLIDEDFDLVYSSVQENLKYKFLDIRSKSETISIQTDQILTIRKIVKHLPFDGVYL